VRILLVHNHYQQRGGEDVVFELERNLLLSRGHIVETVVRDSQTIGGSGGMGPARVAVRGIWSRDSYRSMRLALERGRADVVHVHNTFPLLSPSVFDACRAARVPVVATLHNYRLACVNGLLFRAGGPCEKCLGRSAPWPGVWHACYRGSRAASAAVGAMLAVHNLRGTFTRIVSRYIALTDFARSVFIRAGLPEGRISVKPNTLAHDPGRRTGNGDYLLFVGRLSEEKGVRCLLNSWRRLNGVPLKVIGDGPLAGWVDTYCREVGIQQVEKLGAQPAATVAKMMEGAKALILPSLCYEGFPMTALEAFARGVPVIASGVGALQEIVRHRSTGLLFRAGDERELAAAVTWVWEHTHEVAVMGDCARQEFVAKYSAERNYGRLMEIYEQAIDKGVH
jgi:glycosyltransferase involved in cell wall biosynthesis